MSVFYVSRQGKQEGPHSLQVIASKLNSGYLRSTDYIYDSAAKDWCLLNQFSSTKAHCKGAGDDSAGGEDAWYLLRGDHQLGPYTYGEVIDLLQQKQAFDHDYIWKASMASWERVSDTEYFHPDFIVRYQKNQGTKGPVHFRRKAPRVNLRSSLIVHNQRKLWNGDSFEVSQAGASIEVPKDHFIQGDVLVLHYRPSLEVPAFNVHCEIINIQDTEKKEESKVRLGLRFIKVNNLAQKVLNQYLQQRAA